MPLTPVMMLKGMILESGSQANFFFSFGYIIMDQVRLTAKRLVPIVVTAVFPLKNSSQTANTLGNSNFQALAKTAYPTEGFY